MKTPFDFNDPPALYVQRFDAWLNENITTLRQLHADFLKDTGATRYDAGCSIDEFCAGMFRETKAGEAALLECQASQN